MKRGLFIATFSAAVTTVLLGQSAALASTKVPAGQGTIGIRLVAATGAPSSNPLGSSYIVTRLAPGDSLSRIVEIDDDSKSSVEVSLYVAAATVVRGKFVFAAGNVSNDLTSWTSLAHKAIYLAPESKARDTVTIRVPHDASAGNQYAVVWAAVSAAPPGGKGITLVSRVGVRMYVAVGPGGGKPSNFVLGNLSAIRGASGRSLVHATIRNSGANTLDLNGFLTLTDGPGGLHAGPFTAKLGVVLAPGASELATVALAPNFPRGPWKAELNIRSGELARSTTRTITFPARFAAGKSSGKTFPIQLSTILFALLASALLFLLVRRRRRRLRHRRATRIGAL
jgi:hypothetical protein